ncbi:hypothetical protein [Streptomyces sp. NPDC058254]|uniref:hypothetical protein n=1 Tax=Streptomyces sp. NPDC058254 TaxID=3346406 RepID=UPI0036E8224F
MTEGIRRPDTVLGRFQAQLAYINDVAFEMSPETPEMVVEVQSALRAAAETLTPLTGVERASSTGCSLHPEGAVDPVAPPTWGRCLLCNTRRRRGLDVQPRWSQI